MKQFTNRALAALFALSLICGSASVALADRGGNDHGNGKAKAHAKVSTPVHGKSASHAKSSVRDNDSDAKVASSRGKSSTAHSCINPAGNQRGWCKSHTGGDFVTGRVTAINGNMATVMLSNGQTANINDQGRGLTVGQQVTLRGDFENDNFVANNGAYTNYNGPYSSASVRGLIISVNGNSIQIVQGLSLITINDANAASRGTISGTLYPGRTITAAGNWNGSTFIANSIQ